MAYQIDNWKGYLKDVGLWMTASGAVSFTSGIFQCPAPYRIGKFIKVQTAGLVFYRSATDDQIYSWNFSAGEMAPILFKEIIESGTDATGIFWGASALS